MYPAKYWKRFVDTPFANNKYILKKYLGSGGFGAVFLADEVIADRLIRQVAIKLVEVETHPDNDTEIDSVDLNKKIKELQLAVQLQHPCLINCYTVEQDTLDDNPFLGLVMEIAQISLETYQKDNSLSEEELKEIVKAIALGLDYLHGQNIVHRDIKPANILKVNNQWKIGDFGVSRLLETGKTSISTHNMGTPAYASPEACNGVVSKAWDVWSLGIMTCELMTGQHPFPYTITEQLLRKIYNEEPQIPENLESSYQEIIKGCLIRDHQQRWTTQEVLEALTVGQDIDYVDLLELALSSAESSDKSVAIEQAKSSFSSWLQLRGIEAEKVFDLEIEEDCKLIKSIIFQEDELYFTKLRQFIEKVDQETTDDLTQMKNILSGWSLLKRWGSIPSLTNSEESQKTEKSNSDLSVFSFEVVTVNKQGEIITQETKQAEYYTEILPDSVELEMVYIPGGTFRRGSDFHRVWIAPFYMSKYPITQAQWRAVTSLLKIKTHLNSDPSVFKKDSLPVEGINWYSAVEFCNRLTKDTGNYYRLPSEAQWEYACRAGTTTPFYFGEILTKKLANYFHDRPLHKRKSYQIDTVDDILRVAKDHNSGTTSVGTFPPNAFGLYDMHGNVLEWCADKSHSGSDYKNAPVDGSIWLENGYEDDRVLKGGCWMSEMNQCVSNYFYNLPTACSFMDWQKQLPYYFSGFRIISILSN